MTPLETQLSGASPSGPASPSGGADVADRRPVAGILVGHQELVRVAALAILIAIGTILRPSFISEHSVMSVLLPAAPLACLATAEAFVMIRGKLVDLSVGATASACALVAVSLSSHGVLLAIVVPLLLGAVIGAINGVGVGVFRGNPIIITLGMGSVVGAVALGRSGGNSETLHSGLLESFGGGSVAGVPDPVIAVALILVATSVLFTTGRWGRLLRLGGDSEEAFASSGRQPVTGTILAFVLAGVFSALGGVVLASYVGTLDFSVASNETLPAVAGAVIGGVSLFGGEGSPWQAGFGAVLLGFLTSVLLVAGLSPYQEEIVEGVLVVAIVYVTERLLVIRR
jgi:ribose/xylose/arabinose/galactoside ABC-type transport system permease subunit